LRKIGESQDAVNVSFSGYWIELGDVEPNYSLQSVLTNFLPAWVSANTNSLPLKERMYATLREEQDEIRNKVPVYDTLVTINKNMNLFEAFEDVLDCRWLPTGHFEPTEPTGIEFMFNGGIPESVILQIQSGKLFYNNRVVAKNDTLEAKGEVFKARLVVNDYTVSKDILEEIKLKYTLWIESRPRSESEY